VRKFMILGALVALVVAALALPALAQQVQKNDIQREDNSSWDNNNRGDNNSNWWDDNNNNNNNNSNWWDNNNNSNWWDNNNWWDTNNWWDNNNQNNDTPAVSQENEQSADSGDLNQSFNVTGGGANSNQCVGGQQVGNTGNAQNQIGVIQYGSQADDFSFEDSGASINVSPTNMTRCDQQVNQAASAFGGR
jgi:hypothetical protein